MPFLEAHIALNANIQSESEIWLDSKIVPTVTVNCFRQVRHFFRPGRQDAPFSEPTLVDPQ